jgi:hypothetical protein
MAKDPNLVCHLHQYHLADRWQISHKTLERWRYLKVGPDYLKIGGRVVYRITDVEAFEEQQLVRCGPLPCKPIGSCRSNPNRLSNRPQFCEVGAWA